MLNPLHTMEVVCPSVNIGCEHPFWRWCCWYPCRQDMFAFEDGGIEVPEADMHSMTVTHSCRSGYAVYAFFQLIVNNNVDSVTDPIRTA